MSGGRIVIVSGPPGAGKSTVARRLAESADALLAVLLHSDDFYAYIRKGYVPPWKSESHAQNTIVLDALAASASVYAKGGYAVFVDGIVGPWFFDPWLRIAREQALNVHYVLLLPDLPTTLARATARSAPALTDPQPVQIMWQQFARLDGLDDHVFDTTRLTTEQTVETISAAIVAGRLVLRS
jgi:predicted kinase